MFTQACPGTKPNRATEDAWPLARQPRFADNASHRLPAAAQAECFACRAAGKHASEEKNHVAT